MSSPKNAFRGVILPPELATPVGLYVYDYNAEYESLKRESRVKDPAKTPALSRWNKAALQSLQRKIKNRHYVSYYVRNGILSDDGPIRSRSIHYLFVLLALLALVVAFHPVLIKLPIYRNEFRTLARITTTGKRFLAEEFRAIGEVTGGTAVVVLFFFLGIAVALLRRRNLIYQRLISNMLQVRGHKQQEEESEKEGREGEEREGRGGVGPWTRPLPPSRLSHRLGSTHVWFSPSRPFPMLLGPRQLLLRQVSAGGDAPLSPAQ